MILPMAWRDVRAHQRVILPTGRVVHVLPRVPGMPEAVGLRAAGGQTRLTRVNPDEIVPVVVERRDMTVAILAAVFPGLEYLGEG